MKTKEQIIEWLKSNGLYNAFASNLRNFFNCDVKEHIDKLGAGKWRYLIVSAFDWEATDEGGKFWNDANTKFIQWLSSDEHTELSSDRWIFDRGSREAPFYMVLIDDDSSSGIVKFCFPTFELALGKAHEVCKIRNRKAYVFAAVSEIHPEVVTKEVSINDMEGKLSVL